MALAPLPSYEGETIAWQAGNGGLNVNLNPSRIPIRALIQAQGIVYYDDDWRREPGTMLLATGSPGAAVPPFQIFAIADWHPTELTQRLVVAAWQPSPLRFGVAIIPAAPPPMSYATLAAINTTMPTSVVLVPGGAESGISNRKLFVLSDAALPTYIDGTATTLTAVPKPAADWNTGPPICGVVNGNRLWCAGSSYNPHAVYASVQGAHTDFQTTTGSDTDTQVLSIFPGVGSRIYALTNYQQQIIVWKYPRGVFAIDARSSSPGDWTITQLTDAIGVCQSPYAAVAIDADVLFCSSQGLFYLLSAVVQTQGQSGLAPQNLSLDLGIYQYLTTTLDKSALKGVQSIYFGFRQVARFVFARLGDGGVNQGRLDFDFARASDTAVGPRVSYSYRDTAAAIALWRDTDLIEKPMTSDYRGTVTLGEQPSRQGWLAPSYPTILQTPHTNLSEFETFLTQKFTQLAQRQKQWDYLQFEYVAFTPSTVQIQVVVDGKLRPELTVTETLKVTSGAVTRFSQLRKLGGIAGWRISFIFSDSAPGDDWAIMTLFLSFRPGAATLSPRDL